MGPILQIERLSKHFGGIKAVSDVGFSLEPGSFTGIYGENGAGKTTLFNLISGLERPDEGVILLDGKDITGYSVLRRARAGMGRLFQAPRVFPDVSVFDNLMAASDSGSAHRPLNYLLRHRDIRREHSRDAQRAGELLQFFSLSKKGDDKAHTLSVGERKMLSLGSLLMNNNRLILLDELSSGLNGAAADRIKGYLLALRAGGVTFLMIEHDRELLEAVCDRTLGMSGGKIVTEP